MVMNSPIHKLLNFDYDSNPFHQKYESVLLMSSNAFGMLQRDLITNIGLHRMKSFFYQYGFHLGKEDAEKVLKIDSLSLDEKINYGPIIHGIKGFEKAHVSEKNIVFENEKLKSCQIKGYWTKSFEVEQHIKNFGKSQSPVCYTLIGLASGYISTIIGERMYFKELQCEAEGTSCCVFEGRLVSEWGDEEIDSFTYCEELPIIKELEQTNEKLNVEKKNLELVSNVYHDLTNELIKGNGIRSILEVLNKKIDIPIVVEDIRDHVLAQRGIDLETYKSIKTKAKLTNKKPVIMKTRKFSFENQTILVTPIYLLRKVVGYCTFIYKNGKLPNYDVDTMIIERLSSVASLLFLKEKTEVESMERVKGYFLEEIIDGRYTNQEIIRKADYIQLDLSDNYYLVELSYSYLNKYDQQDFTLMINMLEAVADFFKTNNMNVLHSNKDDSIILLITEKQLNKRKIESVMFSLISFLKKEIKNSVLFIGISSKYSNIMEVDEAVSEARAAVRLSTKEKPMTTYNELGVIGILINNQNEKTLRKLVKDTLGNLYDDLNTGKIELLETLDYFFMNGGNLEQTANQLALSISGVRYRINKITNILGQDIRVPDVQYHLQTALKVLKIIDYEKLTDVNGGTG